MQKLYSMSVCGNCLFTENFLIRKLGERAYILPSECFYLCLNKDALAQKV